MEGWSRIWTLGKLNGAAFHAHLERTPRGYDTALDERALLSRQLPVTLRCLMKGRIIFVKCGKENVCPQSLISVPAEVVGHTEIQLGYTHLSYLWEGHTHSSSLAWRITWTEEPGRLQSLGSQRVGHYWATNPAFYLWPQWPLYKLYA